MRVIPGSMKNIHSNLEVCIYVISIYILIYVLLILTLTHGYPTILGK